MRWCEDCALWHSDTDDCILKTKGTTMWDMLKRFWSWLCGEPIGEKTTSCGGSCVHCSPSSIEKVGDTMSYVPELPESNEEWETTNERTVKWNKEQTAHLRQRLASVSPPSSMKKTGPAPEPTKKDGPADASYCPLSDPLNVLNPLSPLSPISPISVWDNDPTPSAPTDTGSMASGISDAVSDYGSSSSYDSGSSSSYDSGSSSDYGGSDW